MSTRTSVLRTTVHMVFTRPSSRKNRTAKQWLERLRWLTGSKLGKPDKLGRSELTVLERLIGNKLDKPDRIGLIVLG